MPEKKTKTVVAAALGECVHVAGVMNFLRLAELAGWRTIFLGPAVLTGEVIAAARQEKADLVAVSYRLTPETGERLIGDFAEAADDLRRAGVRFAFGGTPPLVQRVARMGFFEKTFQGGEPADEVLAYLKGQAAMQPGSMIYPQTAIDRILWKQPYPILRHHFGLPDVETTRLGIAEIAEAGALDVISLGIDQDAQENFFHPERQDPRRKGAGGVPVRSEQDYRLLYGASRRGNFPLMRTYSGTDDFIKLGKLYVDSIQIAWCAIPLFWFNRMDGRGPWDLEGSIRQHQAVMAWYADQNIPVELNEAHHWGMRDAPDIIFVVISFLAAYNARAFGVRDYICPLMFNSPPGTSDSMDLAKMLAVKALLEPLAKPDFRIWWQTRTGLLSYPTEPNAARAHLAASVYLQMALRPDIVHVVGFCEADHAATSREVIESCVIARRAIENAMAGQPDMTVDPLVQERSQLLVDEASITLESIRRLARPDTGDPLTDPPTLTESVTRGVLDAPHLRNNAYARGRILSRVIGGACHAVGKDGKPIGEAERLNEIGIGGSLSGARKELV
jgi:methylmalonyl-CoA mutase cobalamin-binding subunit